MAEQDKTSIPLDASAPPWATSMARLLETIFFRLFKRIRDLEARVKALEGP